MTNTPLKTRLMRTAVLSVLALFAGAGIALFQISSESGLRQNTIAPMAGMGISGTFALTDQNGIAVTDADFKTNFKLVYFGFTYCPMVCPTELKKISNVIKQLGPLGESVQPIFITVDPERDTPAVLKDYVSLYHPRLVGLTGTREQIDATKQTFKVFAAKAQNKDANDYTMDHSSFIYLMGPDNELVALYRVEDDPDYIVQDLKARISSVSL